MVDHVDAKDTPGPDHGAREFDVLMARLGVARRVVMGKHDRAGMSCHGWGEDLPSFDRNMSDRAQSHYLHGDQAQADIEKEDSQGLLISRSQ